jgi:hypothetical protein
MDDEDVEWLDLSTVPYHPAEALVLLWLRDQRAAGHPVKPSLDDFPEQLLAFKPAYLGQRRAAPTRPSTPRSRTDGRPLAPATSAPPARERLQSLPSLREGWH